MKKRTEKAILTGVIIVTTIVLTFYIYSTFMPKSPLKEKKPSVEIIEINGECSNCFNVEQLVEIITSNDVEIKSRKTLDYKSEEAKLLIEKHELESVPALILMSKNIDKINVDSDLFSIEGNYAVFDRGVPYIEINTGKIKGLVNLKEIYDPSCKDCASLSSIQRQLETLGIKTDDYEAVDSSTDAGKILIEENNLTFLPNLVISKDIEEYWWIFDQISSVLIEKNNYYVFGNPVAPYKDISTGNIKGKVEITYLTNKSCEDCFNATLLKPSFQRLGIYIDKEKNVDVSSSQGKNLLIKYKITAFPTVILSKETEDYPAIKRTLEQIGTFEKDGSFVLRKLEDLNVKYQEIN